MSNKSDLQQHNTDLSNILSIADGLPLEEVIKALASTGKYAWKKYEMGESGMVVIDILLTNPPLSDSIGTYIRGTVTSSDINVNMLDADDFAGITIPCTVDGGAHSITLGRGGKVSSNNFNPTSWSYNNGEIRIYTPEITMDIFK